MMSFYKNESKCHFYWDYLSPVVGLVGILTAVVMCGVGFDVFKYDHTVGIFTILGSFIVFFLEMTWVVTVFFKVSIGNDNSKISRLWNLILCVKCWKKSLIYFSFSIALLLKPHRLWLSATAGALLLVLGFLHFIFSFERQIRGPGEKSGKLLQNQEDDYCERSQNIFEVLDNSIMQKENVLVEEAGGNVQEI